VTETKVVPFFQGPTEQGEFANSREISEKKPVEKYLAEGSETEQCEDEVLAPNCTDEVNIRDLEIEQKGKQTLSSSSENDHTIEQDSIKEDSLSNNSSVNHGWHEVFSETNLTDHKEVVDRLKQKRRDGAMRDDAVDRSLLDFHVSNVAEFLDSNDETYEEIPLSDEEIPSNKAGGMTKRAKKDKNPTTEGKCDDGSSDCQSIRTVSEYVDSNDETFIDIPLSQKEIGRTLGVDEVQKEEHTDDEWQMESYTDPIREINTGRKRERITDLRELIKEKKRKFAAEDSEKRATSRNRRRVVEIVKHKSVVPDDSTSKISEIADETSRNVASPVPDSDVVIPDLIKAVLENMTSPDSGSCFSIPDHAETLDEMRRKISSPDFDKERRSASPESESRTSTPDWNPNEHRRLYNRRRAGSSDSSRAESSAGSRPGSSASSRHGSNPVSRPGSIASLRTGSNVSLRSESSTKRFPPPKRARVEKDTPDKTRAQARSWSGRVLDINYPKNLSDRGLDEDYPTNLSDRGLDEGCYPSNLPLELDENFSRSSPVGSRHQRQRSISPSVSKSHYSYVSERDNPTPPLRLSPARESRYRSRYSIKRYDARSSSNDSGSSRARHHDRNNNNWSRHDERPDMDQTTKSQIDFSDETFLSSKLKSLINNILLIEIILL
jgi:hypothetical protein